MLTRTNAFRIAPPALALIVLGVWVTSARPAEAATAVTEAVSVTAAGEPVATAYRPAMTADARFVAFSSTRAGLVVSDTDAVEDVFVRDRKTAKNVLVSVDSSERKGNNTSRVAHLSDDGRFVVFESIASNLVRGDTNRTTDIFVRDVKSGTTARVSVATGGRQADSFSSGAKISGNGRFVAFVSMASTLVAGDTNGSSDVFVRDLKEGTTERVSIGPGGQARSGSGTLGISADGRYVLFTMYANSTTTDSAVWVRDRVKGTTTSLHSRFAAPQALALSRNGRFAVFLSADALVRGDTNGKRDVFVRDLVKGVTERVSVSSSEGQVSGTMAPGGVASISDDGRFVAFGSGATNLVPGDTNNFEDVFLRDRSKGTTVRVVPGVGGAQPNNTTSYPVLDSTGRFVAVANAASNVGPRAGVLVRDRGGL